MQAKVESINVHIETLESKKVRMAKKQLASEAKFAMTKNDGDDLCL